MAVWQKTGREPQKLADAPRLPDGCEQLWSDFADLHGCRGSTGFGPMRITFGDLDAWQRVQGVRLPAWQIAAIRGADNAYLASWAEQNKGKDHG